MVMFIKITQQQRIVHLNKKKGLAYILQYTKFLKSDYTVNFE